MPDDCTTRLSLSLPTVFFHHVYLYHLPFPSRRSFASFIFAARYGEPPTKWHTNIKARFNNFEQHVTILLCFARHGSSGCWDVKSRTWQSAFHTFRRPCQFNYNLDNHWAPVKKIPLHEAFKYWELLKYHSRKAFSLMSQCLTLPMVADPSELNFG